MSSPTDSLDEDRMTFQTPPDELPCFDPVCGRSVNRAAMFTPNLDRDGTKYAFCSAACRARFKANPDAYNSEHHA